MLAIGGQVKAETYEHVFASGQLSKSEGIVTLSDVAWSQSALTYVGWDSNPSNKGVQLGSGSKPAKSFTLSTNAISGTITKIVVNASMASGGDAKLSVNVGGVAYGSEVSLVTAATDYTFTGSGNGEIKILMSNTTKAMYIKSIRVEYTTDGKTPTTLTFAEGNKIFVLGASEGLSFTNVATLNPAVAGATIQYSSDNDALAVVDENTGEVLVSTGAVGKATITATYAGDVTYSPSTASYSIFVNNGDGTIENPYTTRDVIELLKTTTSIENIHVKGSVKDVGTVNSTYKSRTYTITDGTSDLLIYSGKSFNSNAFDLDYQVAVGDEIVIKGNAKTYAGTSEMDYNNVVVSQTRNRSTTANKYGTICLPYAGTVTGGTLYSVDGIVNGELTLTEVATPEAGVPYVFLATGEKLSVAFTAGAAAAAATSAYLVGVSAATQAPVGTYVLQTIDGVQKFRLVAEGEQPNVPAGRAYLTVSNPSREFIGFADTTTALNAIEALTSNKAEIYDLNGRKLTKLQKGVNIVNGTKVVVK